MLPQQLVAAARDADLVVALRAAGDGNQLRPAGDIRIGAVGSLLTMADKDIEAISFELLLVA